MSKKNSFLSRPKESLFPPERDIHLSVFILLAIGGIIVSVVVAFYNLAMGFGIWNFLAIIIAGVSYSVAMIAYTVKTGLYRGPMVITVFVVFIGLFTYLFFTSGGYNSGFPLFFVMSIVFTAFMLDGPMMPILAVFEFLWYAGLCIFAYKYPTNVKMKLTGTDFVADLIVSLGISSIVLASTAYFEVRIYRKKQIELEHTRLEAEKANKAKTDFIARMSHDVRTPLNTIMAMNELITQNTSAQNIKEWIEDSNNSAQILLSLVNDMLDISRIEAGKAELNPKPYSTTSFFLDMEKAWETQIIRGGLHFSMVCDNAIPSVLCGDSIALRKIIDNLLSNALKYTKSGNITLSAVFIEPDILTITVTDTGCGIEKENIERIFKPFERGSLVSAIKGSGLGLAIVRELTDFMKGNISCESAIGVGSSFTVSLPQEVVDNAPIKKKKKWPGQNQLTGHKNVHNVAPGATVLVVDDNQYNRKVITQLLDPMLVRVDDVESGHEALEMIDIKHYDLILMDLRMPDLDGRETFELIKKEYPGFDTPVVALTAEIIGGVEESVLRQGFAGYLSKPVNSSQLYETIVKFAPDKVVAVDDEAEDTLSEEEIGLYQDRLYLYGINIRQSLEYSAGDPKEFLLRTSLFEEYAPGTINMLEKLRGSSDYYIQMHSVKSIAKGIGAWVLADLAEAVEIRRDEDFSNSAHELLLQEFRKVNDGIKLFREKRGRSDEE